MLSLFIRVLRSVMEKEFGECHVEYRHNLATLRTDLRISIKDDVINMAVSEVNSHSAVMVTVDGIVSTIRDMLRMQELSRK